MAASTARMAIVMPRMSRASQARFQMANNLCNSRARLAVVVMVSPVLGTGIYSQLSG
jgi:hypothetical protein